MELSLADPLNIHIHYCYYNNIRRAKLMLFSAVCKTHEEFNNYSLQKRWEFVEAIEMSCYNTTIKKAIRENIPDNFDNSLFLDIYNSLCYKISSNLEKTGQVVNTYLIHHLMKNPDKIPDIANLSGQELFIGKYDDILEKLEMSKNIQISVKTTEMYWCRRCKKNKCTERSIINRSLDEGTSMKIKCENCNLEWII